MKKSGLNKNQVSKISGISNTFLTKIEQLERDGNRIDIRRQTLINLAVSLNLSIVEINDLLNDYNHYEVSTSDTPYFLSASERQNVTGILPLFSSLALEWFLIGMEKKVAGTEGASLVYMLDQPSHLLKSPEHASYVHGNESNDRVIPVYKDLVASACLHRKKLMTEALERGNLISTYICCDCLENYIRRWQKYKGTGIEDKYKAFLKQHFETFIKYIETYPDRYQVKLLNKCQRIKYELLYLPELNKQGRDATKISKIFFHAHETNCSKSRVVLGGIQDIGFGQGFGNLIGFATDSKNITEFFHKQHLGLMENFTDLRFDTPEKVVAHLRALISEFIPQ